MENVSQYLISVTSAAIICSVVTTLLGKKGTSSSIVRLLCGLFLAVTVISPLVDWQLADFSEYWNDIKIEADDSVAVGESVAIESAAAIIKSQVEAYILDKASSMGLDISVEVTLDNSSLPQPERVFLSGAASPYVKDKLQQVIASDLGIPEENQTWT